MRVTRKGGAIAALLVMMAIPSTLAAQAQPEEASEDIVVSARRSGAPMWTVDTPSGVVILVGEIIEVPKATPWRPERLERATEQSQRIILGTKAKVSPGDIFRLIFRGGKLTKLPEGHVAADYLDAAQQAQLARLAAKFDQDYSRKNFLITAFDLLAKRLDFNRDTTDTATDVVRKAGVRAKVPMQHVGEVRGEDMLDNLFAAAPASHIPCLDAAMTAAEQGNSVLADRGRAWTGFDVPAVLENPLEVALGRCWPWTSDSFGPLLRQQWVTAIHDAAGQQGVTLAVVPLRILAEPEGVLDQLERSGLAIKGPAWRPSQRPDREQAAGWAPK